MWGVQQEEKKQVLRAAVLSQRSSLPEAESLRRSALIQAKVLTFPYYRAAVATGEIMAHALSNQKTVFFPRVGQENSVEFFQTLSLADLKAGRFGILEPTGTKSLSESDFEGAILFVPGVAFDLQGNRLGRGQGWYDRAMERLGDRVVCVALAYEIQIVDEVPTHSADQRVKYVITEERLVECDAASTPWRQMSSKHP
jgi:5-formyltetrahydrofolate cyclo-ligase